MSEGAERVEVRAPGGAYEVRVGPGVRAGIGGLVPAGTRRALLLTQPGVEAWADDVREALRGVEVTAGVVPSGEEAKTLAQAGRWWDACGDAGLGRGDVVVAVGGGAVTDLAGFVAAGWMRGIGVIHVPTTLLGMVDAAVGGKTGVNTPHGKNLVGAFHHPLGVLCDTQTLGTLPGADLVAGLAEVVKCGLIADPRILELLDAPAGAGPRGLPLEELVLRSVSVKARVVGQDPREGGLREILNYGHTFGHAVEQVEGYRWRHGDAVAVGMVFVAELARALGVCDDALVARHRSLLEGVGLPTRYPGRPGDWPALLAAMRQDKKSRQGALRFVTLAAEGRCTITPVDPVAHGGLLAACRDALR